MTTGSAECGAASVIESARIAARGYLDRNDFPVETLAEVDGPPILGPVVFDRDGRTVTAYRWLGGGRGQTYVQVEMAADTITVRGACGDAEVSEWQEPR